MNLNAKLKAVGMAVKYWLMKAEPDSRIVKGKDVKVSQCESMPS